MTERTFTAAEMRARADYLEQRAHRAYNNGDPIAADELYRDSVMLRQGAAAIKRWEALKAWGDKCGYCEYCGEGWKSLSAEMTRLEGECDHE